MARFTDITTNFSGGLITDYVSARTELPAIKNGARKFTNFVPLLQGPTKYRPGFERKNTATDGVTELVSAEIILGANSAHRAVFEPLSLKIYDNQGVLVQTITTAYTVTDLPDLRFASETDSLYVVHPNHKPKLLTNSFTVSGRRLTDSGDVPLDDSEGANLFTASEANLSATWSFNDILFDVEPFLEPDTSDTEITVQFPYRLLKLTSDANDFAEIVADHSASPAGEFSQTWYVEFKQGGQWILGQVVDGGTGGAADPTTTVVYVQPVEQVVDIQDPDAKFYVLDNYREENGDVILPATYSSGAVADDMEHQEALELDGVDRDKIHLRSDTLVFNQNLRGAWLRVSPEERDLRVPSYYNQSAGFAPTRWFKLGSHLGTQAHPNEFYRGTDAFELKNFERGSVYKVFSNEAGRGTLVQNPTTQTYFYSIAAGTDDGHLDVIQGAVSFFAPFSQDNRMFTFYDHLLSDKQSHTIDHSNIATKTISGRGSSPDGTVVGNMSSMQEMDVMEVDVSTNSSNSFGGQGGYVRLYSGGNGNLISPIGVLTIDTIYDDVELVSSKPLFDKDRDDGRFILLEFPNHYAVFKLLALTGQTFEMTSTVCIADTMTIIPRDNGDPNIANLGQSVGFQLGAWYTGSRPRTVAKYERRIVYGGTNKHANYLFLSRTDDEFNFQPAQDDKVVLDTDAITYPISPNNASIRWLAPSTKELVMGTTGGIFRLRPNDFNAGVSPKNIRIEISDEQGGNIPGTIVGASLFFPNSAGTQLLEYRYDQTTQQSVSDDVTKFIFPTFVQDKMVQIAHQRVPQPRIWVRTESNTLYCLTHHRKENYYAWSKHETQGDVLDICVLKEVGDSAYDALFVTTKRDGKYNIEVLTEENTENEIHLDCFEKVTDFDPSSNTTTHNSVAMYDLGDFANIPLEQSPYEYRVHIFNETTQQRVKVVDSPGIIKNGNEFLIPQASIVDTVQGTDRWTVYIGLNYIGELQMMFPTWDGGTKPAYSSEDVRVVSSKQYLIDSYKYQLGIKGEFARYTLNDGNTSFTGFDKERPVVNSQYGPDFVPEFKHDQPFDLTIASVVVKTDIGSK